MTESDPITQSIDWLVARWPDQPSLEDAATHVGMEPTRFQKLFTAQVGLSPKRFVQVMTHRYARDLLASGDITTLEAAYDAGLSGNGRLHDLFVTIEAATPGEIRSKGQGMIITYGYAPSPYGELIAARTQRGLCYLGFRVDDTRDRCLERIRKAWPNAIFIENNAAIAADVEAVTAICAGTARSDRKIPLHLFGTNFQMQVWQALLKIPSGHFLSYENLGAAIGRPGSPRAVGNAVGANPVSLLIPCHRVIQKTGILNNYGWGSARKKALLGVECCATKVA
jgi:AraC family transcriptional regulator of adaptative response/methylated-DNA-[protein]-cysteine methyltransferase